MINEQIIVYVTSERTRGVSDEAISHALLAQGWKAEDVASALGGSQGGVPVVKELSFGNLFSGRLGRWPFFSTGVLLGLSVTLLGIIISLTGFIFGNVSVYVILAIYLASVPLSFSLSIRRAHDIGWSGWTVLLSFVPFVNFVYALLLLFMKGSAVSNTYGQPQVNRNFKNTLLNL